MIAELLVGSPPRAGRVKVVGVEGRSGSGKSTLADRLATELRAPVVRMDHLYPGWDGLAGGVDALVRWVLEPLAAGRPASWRRYDWAAGQYAEAHRVPDSDVLIVEGVGVGARIVTPYLSLLIWLDLPEPERRRRALDRDGDIYAPHWDRWAAHEDAFYRDHDVRARADLVLPAPEETR